MSKVGTLNLITVPANLTNITSENFNRKFKFFEDSIYDTSKDLFGIRRERKGKKNKAYSKKGEPIKETRHDKEQSKETLPAKEKRKTGCKVRFERHDGSKTSA